MSIVKFTQGPWKCAPCENVTDEKGNFNELGRLVTVAIARAAGNEDER